MLPMRGGLWSGLVAGALLLSACGQASTPEPHPAPMPSPVPPSMTAGNVPAAPMDPAHDDRPDRVKLEDFGARLTASQDALAGADARYIGQMRGALQSGSQDQARASLGGYSAAVRGQLDALPATPRLNGCFARAGGADDAARDAAKSALMARHDKLAALTAITFRPLSLADLGGLVTDAQDQPRAAQQVKVALAGAQAQVSGCAVQPPRTAGADHPLETSPSQALEISPTSPAGPPQSAPDPVPPRRPTLLDRVRRSFQH